MLQAAYQTIVRNIWPQTNAQAAIGMGKYDIPLLPIGKSAVSTEISAEKPAIEAEPSEDAYLTTDLMMDTLACLLLVVAPALLVEGGIMIGICTSLFLMLSLAVMHDPLNKDL